LPKSIAEENDSSCEDEGLGRSCSDASDNFYQKPIEEKKPWDKYLTTKDAGGSASEKHNDFIRKAEVGLKIITIVVTFCVVLTAGVVSKGALLFIIAQVRKIWIKGNNI
jgi:hypothetical protein